MDPVQVSILVPKSKPVAGLATAVTFREQLRVDDFAEAMRLVVKSEVPVLEGDFTDAPVSGYVLAFKVPADVDPHIARRTVAFDEDRASVMRRIEQCEFAGAVEKQRYFEWCTRREVERGYGLIGRKEAVARMPARIVTGQYTSALWHDRERHSP